MAIVSGTTFFNGKVPPTPVAAQPTSSKGLGEQLWSSIAGAASAGAQQVQQGVSEINAGAPGKNPLIGGVEAALKVGSGVASIVSAPLAPVFAPLGAAVNAVGDKISDIPAVQTFANSSAGKTTARVAEDLSNAGNIAGTILGADQLAKIPAKIQNMSNTIEAQVKSKLAPIETDSAKTQTKIAKIAQEWKQPAETPGNTFKNARTILQNDASIPEFLINQKIDPEMHISDGRYTTLDSAEALQETAGKISADGLRPSLQYADYVTPKTPVSEITKDAITQLSKNKEATPGDVQASIAQITKEEEALQAKYPDGMSLTDMHDNKITFSKNAGYSPIKDPAVAIRATGNRALSNAFGDAVENKAPSGVPVKEFNAYLSKYYKAADYLESLNGKKAPTTLLQKARGAVLKFGSAALGQSFGGGVVSAFAGYTVGKALEHALENMPNPVRTTFLNNLQHTNPEAFVRVEEYLKQQSSGNTGIPRLKAPDENTPIQLGPETATPLSNIAPQAAKAPYPLPRDPKTGKIMKTFLSTPK